MLKKIYIISFCLIVCFISGLYIFKWYCLKHYPVQMEYPKIPKWSENAIRKADRFVCFTSGIIWYEAIDQKTKEKYFINVGKEGIWMKPMKDEEEDTWVLITNEEYLDKFEFDIKPILERKIRKVN